MSADNPRILHARYGYGWARGRAKDGKVSCRFDRVFGGRWVPLQADEVQRVTLTPWSA